MSESDEDLGLGGEIAGPGDMADPQAIVRDKIPADIWAKYEIFSYRNAAVILAESCRAEFADLLETLRRFHITTELIRRAGGNESEIPKLFSAMLRPNKWFETTVQGDLLIRQVWREPAASGRPAMERRSREFFARKISRRP